MNKKITGILLVAVIVLITGFATVALCGPGSGGGRGPTSDDVLLRCDKEDQAVPLRCDHEDQAVPT